MAEWTRPAPSCGRPAFGWRRSRTTTCPRSRRGGPTRTSRGWPRTIRSCRSASTNYGTGSCRKTWRITTGIRLNEGDTLIGFLKLTVISWPHRYADIGLGIGQPEHRGQGYGTEAMRLGIDCAFRELNM